MKHKLILLLELLLLATGIILAVLWVRNTDGNYEPFTVLAGLALAILEFLRRTIFKDSDLGDGSDSVKFRVGEETVHFEEKLRSLRHDVIKIEAHTHTVGVAAEYEWIRQRYPGSEVLQQSITTFDLLDGKNTYNKEQVHFDEIQIRLKDGRSKTVFFDISSFFGGGISSSLDPDAAIARKLRALYKQG